MTNVQRSRLLVEARSFIVGRAAHQQEQFEEVD